jgi:hypothetical protein
MPDIDAAYIARDSIVIGCDFEMSVTIDPPIGQSNEWLDGVLAGASASAVILDTDGITVLATATATISTVLRQITVSLTDTITATLTPGIYNWRVRLTTSGGLIWPVRMPRAEVRALP